MGFLHFISLHSLLEDSWFLTPDFFNLLLQTLLSCVFLSTLKEKPNVFELDYFQDAEKIGNAVESGDYSGYFLIYKNYTPHLKRKFQGTMADALLAPTSPIYVALDMTDIQRGK